MITNNPIFNNKNSLQILIEAENRDLNEIENTNKELEYNSQDKNSSDSSSDESGDESDESDESNSDSESITPSKKYFDNQSNVLISVFFIFVLIISYILNKNSPNDLIQGGSNNIVEIPQKKIIHYTYEINNDDGNFMGHKPLSYNIK